jgi:hypothetical protein
MWQVVVSSCSVPILVPVLKLLKLRTQVIREREKLYSLLRQTSQQRLKPAADNKWTIDPRTRYLTTTFPFNAVTLNLT